jgi:hypothetical protein
VQQHRIADLDMADTDANLGNMAGVLVTADNRELQAGGLCSSASSPCQMCTSVRQNPAAQTWTMTSIGSVMTGSATVPISKSLRYPVSSAARIGGPFVRGVRQPPTTAGVGEAVTGWSSMC